MRACSSSPPGCPSPCGRRAPTRCCSSARPIISAAASPASTTSRSTARGRRPASWPDGWPRQAATELAFFASGAIAALTAGLGRGQAGARRPHREPARGAPPRRRRSSGAVAAFLARFVSATASPECPPMRGFRPPPAGGRAPPGRRWRSGRGSARGPSPRSRRARSGRRRPGSRGRSPRRARAPCRGTPSRGGTSSGSPRSSRGWRARARRRPAASVQEARGQPGVVGGDVGRRDQRHRDEREPEPDADHQDAGQHVREVGAVHRSARQEHEAGGRCRHADERDGAHADARDQRLARRPTRR